MNTSDLTDLDDSHGAEKIAKSSKGEPRDHAEYPGQVQAHKRGDYGDGNDDSDDPRVLLVELAAAFQRERFLDTDIERV